MPIKSGLHLFGELQCVQMKILIVEEQSAVEVGNARRQHGLDFTREGCELIHRLRDADAKWRPERVLSSSDAKSRH
jgi:hypothetical protein